MAAQRLAVLGGTSINGQGLHHFVVLPPAPDQPRLYKTQNTARNRWRLNAQRARQRGVIVARRRFVPFRFEETQQRSRPRFGKGQIRTELGSKSTSSAWMVVLRRWDTTGQHASWRKVNEAPAHASLQPRVTAETERARRAATGSTAHGWPCTPSRTARALPTAAGTRARFRRASTNYSVRTFARFGGPCAALG